jgi:hypothetical protein
VNVPDRLTAKQYLELDALRAAVDAIKGPSFLCGKHHRYDRTIRSLLRRRLMRWWGDKRHTRDWRWTDVTAKGREALKQAPQSVRREAKRLGDKMLEEAYARAD